MVVAYREPSSTSLLTSHLQLCLAHYCDLHGPTPLMVTEGLPVPCSRCYDDTLEPDRPQTSSTTSPQASVTDALRKMTLTTSRSSSAPASDQEVHRAALRRSKLVTTSAGQSVTAASPTTASAIETPPQSPRKAPASSSDKPGGPRRDSSFHRTYDDTDTKRANPCQNCALTLPKRQDNKEVSKDSKTMTATCDSQLDTRGPTLRTRTPYARVYGGSADASPPISNPQSSCASDTEDDVSPKDTTARPCEHRPTTSTSHSSISSKSSVNTHTHYLDYTSTHVPQVPNTFTNVRNSCLRTLSFEVLPRRADSSPSSTISSPISGMPPSYSSPPPILSSPAASQSAASGGPIFFGDPITGYTTAYIFRIPDVHARGRKRVYAFLALSTHRERLAMKAFGFMAAAFRDLATWIQDLAEAEAEREKERFEENSPIAGFAGYGNGHGGLRDSGIGLGLGGGFEQNGRDRDRDRDSGSSFLTGGGRGAYMQRMMGGSMGPGGFAPKARGLAELVGMPDFFIQLHTRFVRLLLELGVVLGS